MYKDKHLYGSIYIKLTSVCRNLLVVFSKIANNIQILCVSINWHLLLEKGKNHHSTTFKSLRITFGMVKVWKKNQRMCLNVAMRKYFLFKSILHHLLFAHHWATAMHMESGVNLSASI